MSRFSTCLLFSLFLSCGCAHRSRQEMVDNTRSCTRHMARGLSCLMGRQSDSRQVRSRNEFYGEESLAATASPFPPEGEFLCEELAMAEQKVRPPRVSPGEVGSGIPTIEAFQDPHKKELWQGIFHPIYFSYNSELIKGKENLTVLQGMVGYLKQYPNTYLFIEGHCDERGAEAYNLALGLRRANAVRSLMAERGVHPDHLFTISYGKEFPIDRGHNEEAWAKNRRVAFKIYER